MTQAKTPSEELVQARREKRRAKTQAWRERRVKIRPIAEIEGGEVVDCTDENGVVWRSHVFTESGEFIVTKCGFVQVEARNAEEDQ